MNEEYIAMEDAAERLSVTRPTLYYYLRKFKIQTKKFDLDRRTYLEVADVERIKALKEQAAKRKEGTVIA